MNQKVKLPVLSKETLSEIAYAMENQGGESVFCLDDGNVYPAETLDEFCDDVDSHSFVELPSWTSADGYRLMCAFVQTCEDDKLKRELSNALGSGSRGVFRRFREVLDSHDGALSKWYGFKDRKMGAYILSWYRKLFNHKDIGIESEGDGLPAYDIMVGYDITHQAPIKADAVALIQREVHDPVALKAMQGFADREAFCAYRQGALCGMVAYEVVGDAACVLFYHIEEGSRGVGLFGLLFDFMNRELERRGVVRIAFPIVAASPELKALLGGRGVKSSKAVEIVDYDVASWNGAVESAEIAYVV